MSTKTILVVEDDPAQQAHIREVLAKVDANVVVVDNGKEGFEKAVELKPDLIFMDIVMPEVDGFAACRQITRHEETKDIPVVIVSGKHQEADRVWAKLQGATAVVGKPYQDEELLEHVRGLG
jgi:twitching motility two-component system response regulator PilH